MVKMIEKEYIQSKVVTTKIATSKKKNPVKVPLGLSILLKLSNAVSPKLTFRLALRYFFTPMNFDTPERELPYKNKALLSREQVSGKRITIYTTGRGSKSVLFVHGWSGRPTQFFEMEEQFERAGYRVLTFTAPAHGSSTDKTTHMLEFAESIAYINKMHGPFELIAGHSLGGMAILNAIQMGVSAEKIALIGTPATITEVVKDFCKRLNLPSKIEKKFLEYISSRYSADFEKHSTLQLASKTTIPTMIIHDDQDADVKISAGEELAKTFPNVKFLKTKGLGHHRILYDKKVTKQLLEFCKN